MANPLSRSRLQGRPERDVPEAPLWCSVRSLLACRWDVDERTGRVGRGCAVVQCDGGAVTHFLRTRTISAARALSPAALTAPHARPHRTTITTLAHPPSCTRTLRARTALHAFLCSSSLFCCVLIRSAVLLLTHDKPTSQPHQSRRSSSTKPST
jgi:hypothetical protein